MDFNLKSIVCLLILLVSVDNAFGDEHKALAFLERSNLTLHDVVISVHKFNHKLVYGIVKKLGHNPHSRLHEIYPEAAKVVNASFDKLYQCYDKSINATNDLDIFHRPIGQIVVEYFHAYAENLNIATLKECVQRVKTLLQTLVHLAEHVLECAFNHDKDFEPTKLGLTQFSAYTHEQFVEMVSNNQMNEDDDEESKGNPFARSLLPSKKKNLKDRVKCNLTVDEIAESAKVKSFNWRDLGLVSPVKNQGGCASCYIFAATGAMESAYMRKFNTTVMFNEKTYLDCYNQPAFQNSADCKKGGLPRYIYKYAREYGVVLDQDGDNYTSHVDECKPKPIFTYPTNYCEFNPGTKLQMDKAAQLEAMVIKYGPVAVGIKSTSREFKSLRGPWNKPCIGDKGYKFKDRKELNQYKEHPDVDHAVLVVGFNEKYWVIKNSWGISWGLDGYLLLPKRGNENNCGILTSAYVALFDEPRPSSSTPKPEESTEHQNPSSSTPKPEEFTENQSLSSSTPKLAKSTESQNENFSTPKPAKTSSKADTD